MLLLTSGRFLCACAPATARGSLPATRSLNGRARCRSLLVLICVHLVASSARSLAQRRPRRSSSWLPIRRRMAFSNWGPLARVRCLLLWCFWLQRSAPEKSCVLEDFALSARGVRPASACPCAPLLSVGCLLAIRTRAIAQARTRLQCRFLVNWLARALARSLCLLICVCSRRSEFVGRRANLRSFAYYLDTLNCFASEIEIEIPPRLVVAGRNSRRQCWFLSLNRQCRSGAHQLALVAGRRLTSGAQCVCPSGADRVFLRRKISRGSGGA